MLLLCKMFNKDSNHIYDEINGDWRLWSTTADKYDIKDKNVIILFIVKISIKLNKLELMSTFFKILGIYQHVIPKLRDLAVLFLQGKEIYAIKKHLVQNVSSFQAEEPTVKESDDNPFQNNLKSQRLVDAADEIMKLKNTDYAARGAARHKPPINNNEPLSQHHMLP